MGAGIAGTNPTLSAITKHLPPFLRPLSHCQTLKIRHVSATTGPGSTHVVSWQLLAIRDGVHA